MTPKSTAPRRTRAIQTEARGGALGVESVPKRGSVFRLQLPVG